MTYSLDDFDYRVEEVLPERLLDLAKNTKGTIGTRTYGDATDLLTLTQDGILWLAGKHPELAESLLKEDYTQVPVLKIIGSGPNKIWYHPKTGEKICEDFIQSERQIS